MYVNYAETGFKLRNVDALPLGGWFLMYPSIMVPYLQQSTGLLDHHYLSYNQEPLAHKQRHIPEDLNPQQQQQHCEKLKSYNVKTASTIQVLRFW
jgi:hypothetical protein